MTSMKSVSITVLFVALLASVGCSGSSSGPATVADLPPVLAQAICDKFSECLGPAAPIFLGASGGDCVTTFTNQLADQQVPLWQAGIDSNRLSYDSSMVNACRDALAAADCSALDSSFPAACDAVFTGTIASGGSCSIDAECAGDAWCDQHSTCPGSCTPRAAAGLSCTVDAACQLGLVCNDGTCGAATTVGSACNGPSAPNCDGLLICIGSTDTTAGTCHLFTDVFSAARGAVCDPQEYSLCVTGSNCALTAFDVATSTQTWTCEAPASAGGACHLAFPDQCPANQYCDADPETTLSFDGTCQPLPAAGAPCLTGPTSEAGKVCAQGLACVGEVCGTLARLGAACTSGDACASGSCQGGVCSAPSCD